MQNSFVQSPLNDVTTPSAKLSTPSSRQRSDVVCPLRLLDTVLIKLNRLDHIRKSPFRFTKVPDTAGTDRKSQYNGDQEAG